MIRIIPFLLLLSVAQPQLFRPDTRQRPVPFMRPPQRHQATPFRFQAAASNIETEIRAPPQQESFINGATPFLHRPRPSMGDLPLSLGPSFGLVPPPSVEEGNVEENERKQLHQNKIEESEPTNAEEFSPSPELPLEEPKDDEGSARDAVSVAEVKFAAEEELLPSEPEHINTFEESFDKANIFNPFSLTQDEEVNSGNDEEGRNKKREANPQETGDNFNFPNFPQGANPGQFHNLQNQNHRAESPQNVQLSQFSPPIYRPDQNPNFRQPAASSSPHNLNGFNPPSFSNEENSKSFGFSDHRLPLEGQSGPKSEFNFNQNINPPNRPAFPVRLERPSPSERQESPSLPVRLERPAQPERHERPQPERHLRPQPERHERPQLERHERPQPERHERPQPERHERPSPHIRQERPSPPERPSRPERTENIFQSPNHPSENHVLPKFQFPSFDEAQSNAKPYIPPPEVIQTPSRSSGQQQQLKKGGAIKRKPFKKRQDPLYQATDIGPNQLFQGYPEEEEDETPDRLSTLLQETSFHCLKRKDGYYADEELSCEVFHFCQDGVKHSWLCPNEGSFHQVHLICLPKSEDNICEKSSKFHFVNDYLYQLAGEGTNQSYVKRYYPDGYTEGIAALEERHAISEQVPPAPSKQQYRTPQQPPRNLYQFDRQQEPPRQVQLGPSLKQVQRQQFVESEDYQDANLHAEESNDYPAEEFQHRPSPSFRPFPNYRTGRPTSAIASQLGNQ